MVYTGNDGVQSAGIQGDATVLQAFTGTSTLALLTEIESRAVLPRGFPFISLGSGANTYHSLLKCLGAAQPEPGAPGRYLRRDLSDRRSWS
jgi:hypothetical protein